MHSCKNDSNTWRKPSGLEVADVFRKYSHLLGPMPSSHFKVIRDITNCRTEVLGGHVLECPECNHKEHSYNSCRNRHCPKCQFLTKIKWIEARVEELLPVQYFHVVFTIPHELNPLVLCNKKILYNILFMAASQTLKDVAANPDNLGAEVGFITLLHTWGQNLLEHPHLHVVIPGGGISFDAKKWIHCKKRFLFPVKILSKVFRGKFLELLKKSFNEGNLIFPGRIEYLSNQNNFEKLIKQTRKLNWVVFAKKPFAGPKQVVEYLGNYTHRIAISNYRLIKIENDKVHFWYRDSLEKKNHKKHKIMVLSVKEFMRRFLLHVLPKKFVRIRHFGFLGNRFRKEKILLCKKLHKIQYNYNKTKNNQTESWQELLKRITDIDVTICPKCKIGKLIEIKVINQVCFKKHTIEKLWLDSS